MADITGTNDGETLNGAEAADVIAALGGDDDVFGRDGSDLIDGGDGDDVLYGASGDDTLIGGAGGDVIRGDGGLFSVIGADRLTGGQGGDVFAWEFGSLQSNAAVTDFVTDFAGAGRAGGDSFKLAPSPFDDQPLVFEGEVDAPEIGDTVGFGGNGFTEVFFAFDGTGTILFADSNDNGVFDADDFAVRLRGEKALTADDFFETAFVVRGTGDDDLLLGGDRADEVFGLGGADTVAGGRGDDLIDGGRGADRLDGGRGDDLIKGGVGADTLIGGDGNDRLTGGAGDDLVKGGGGKDGILSGGGGDDRVHAGGGGSNLDGDTGDDRLVGGNGRNDAFGGRGDDTALGGAGADELYGDDGDDVLIGGEGNDAIEGDAGADRLAGGAGLDAFLFFTGSFNPSSRFASHDTLFDFEGAGVAGGDALRLVGGEFAFIGEVDVDPVAGTALPGARDGVTELFYTHRGADTWLIADENDNGVLDDRDFTLVLRGVHDLTEDDFQDTRFVTIGTFDADVLMGSKRDDRIFGLGGDDSISGGRGDDELDGGGGNDTLTGDGDYGFDTLNGSDGDDVIDLSRTDFGSRASGGRGNDLLLGSREFVSFTVLDGDGGRDLLIGGGGSANMNGGAGGDVIVGSPGHDEMFGGDRSTIADGVRDVYVFGTEWGSDYVGFEDDVDKIDLRESGLTFADLSITEDSDGRAQVSSIAGEINFGVFDAENLTESDFLF